MSSRFPLLGLLLSLIIGIVLGDVYLHNPRGSNGRLNEANTNRNNANRLFDSQNNAKGGYCVGPAMRYYEGSYLDVEWAGSHACGSPNVYCTTVIQYMCTSDTALTNQRIRDGISTFTITDDTSGYPDTDPNGDLTYGLHESYDSYQDCKKRERNMGLWIADREVEGNLNPGRRSAIFTRQNNNGNRHGFECAEERDYYPYWHPSQWKDVAVLVDDLALCSFFQTESQNVKAKNYCRDISGAAATLPNNQAACTSAGYQWTSTPPYNIPAPDCKLNSYARDNYLGVTANGQYATYQWKLPNATTEACITTDNCQCVVRLRYNITSAELGTYVDQFTDSIDYTSNAASSPVQDDDRPSVDGVTFQLAMDTTQFGRISQDRSHVFRIRPRDSIPANAKIYNLNVKGKRGNIVQAFPAEEYSFIPDSLSVKTGDYIHFQWTGCDTNPAGNAGAGTDQTDRSNIVQIASADDNIPATDAWISSHTPLFNTPALRTKMGMLDQNSTFCLSYADLLIANNNDENAVEQDVRNCMKLNAAEAYFDGGAIQMNTEGDFWFMSTRNNRFSNRSQKGNIIVTA